jgi:hypothetical protein
MRKVPWRFLVCDGFTAYPDWHLATGVAYLLKCRKTGVFKLGGSTNPYSRIGSAISTAKRNGLELEYVWSIATNAAGRLETYWRKRWRTHQAGGHDWFNKLPDSEVSAFRAVSSFIWRDIPEPDAEWFDCVKGPYLRYSRPKRGKPA